MQEMLHGIRGIRVRRDFFFSRYAVASRDLMCIIYGYERFDTDFTVFVSFTSKGA